MLEKNDDEIDSIDCEFIKAKVSICWMKEKYNSDKLYTYIVDGDASLYEYVLVYFKDSLDIGEIEELDDYFCDGVKNKKSHAVGKSYNTYEEAKLALKLEQKKEAEAWWEKLGQSNKKEDKQKYICHQAFELEKSNIEKSVELYESLVADNYNLSSEPYDRLVIVYKKIKQLDKAINIAEKATEIFQNFTSIQNRFKKFLEKYKVK